jgi:hypothetical protein
LPATGTFLDLLFQGWAEGLGSFPNSASDSAFPEAANNPEALERSSSAATGEAAPQATGINVGLDLPPAASATGALARFALHKSKLAALPASTWNAETKRKSMEADGSAPVATPAFDVAEHLKAAQWSVPWSTSDAPDLPVQTGSDSAPAKPQAPAIPADGGAMAPVGVFDGAALSLPTAAELSRDDVPSKTPSLVGVDPNTGGAGDADSFAELVLSAKSASDNPPRVSPVGVAEPARATPSTAASQTAAISSPQASPSVDRQPGASPAFAPINDAEPSFRFTSASGSDDHERQPAPGNESSQFSGPRKKEASTGDAQHVAFKASAASPATLAPPAQTSQPGAPAAASGAEAKAPQLHSEPAAHVSTPQEVQKPAGSPVSSIELQVKSASSAPLAMRFVARQGQVEIQLKSGDQQTVRTLSENLNGLKAALGESGWDVTSRARTDYPQGALPAQSEPFAGSNPAKSALPLPQDSTQRTADGFSSAVVDRQPPAQAERVGHVPEVQSGQPGGAGGNENRRDTDSGGGSSSGRHHQQDAKQGESGANGHGQGRQPARDAEAWLDSIERKLTSSDGVRTYTGVIR